MRATIAILVLSLLVSCDNKSVSDKTSTESDPTTTQKLFAHRDAAYTNLDFRNTAKETMEENYLSYEFFYNGSGVAVGDINNDDLPDVYFAGNSSGDQLFLNEGNLKFKNISVPSGISEFQGWSTGVSMVDINADGWLDIYVSRAGPSKDIVNRTNRLFINNKDNTFTESAAEYGLKYTGYSVQSAFFDYDLDGDLDMYLLNHPDPQFKAKSAAEHMNDIKSGKIQTDVFYENVNGKFVDQSKEANLVNFGYRHGIGIGDLNRDGYPDLYISSDFEEPDVLCINNGDKTFSNKIEEYFSHISYNSMGNEMVDINNDGLLDLFVVDMAPSDHFRSKAYMQSMNVEKFHRLKNSGYHSQYMFNTLHLNNGNDTYSEIAQLSGIAKTDWSWAPLFFDMDFDGYRDLFVTNGIKENFLFRDINVEVDKKKSVTGGVSLDDLLQIVPSDITANLFYQNINGVEFKDVSGKWAPESNFNSNGVATADFDNDGDMDFITNNIDNTASLYESLVAGRGNNSIKIELKGNASNPQAIGAKVEVNSSNKKQWQELFTCRGYLSSVDTPLIYGLGDETAADVTITWPDRQITYLKNLEANKTHKIDYNLSEKVERKNEEVSSLILNAMPGSGIHFKHLEDDINDYKRQVLLPHSQSNVGPFIAKADVNGDGHEDVFIGGAAGQAGALYIQTPDGTFSAIDGPWLADGKYEDTGALFLDFDGDQDMDLYVVSGGAHYSEGHQNYRDRLYRNDGNGHFLKTNSELPNIAVSGQAVAASDIDDDGDIDLFIGGRIIPDQYPYPPKSYLLKNDNGKFVAQELDLDQMVSSALFTDYDNDGDDDLMVVGEWSSIQILDNDSGSFTKADISTLNNTTGLWFGLEQRDFDGDGDIDYFVGNIGLNTKFKANEKKEFHVYCDDFDSNGTYDLVLSGNYKGKLVPARGRECSSEQMPFIKEQFKDYRSFANASLEDIYGDKINTALHYKADMLYSVFLENKGDGTFSIKQLPWQAQLSPLTGFAFLDVDNDNKEELLTVGNLYNVEVETVRYDAARGSVFSYENGEFIALNPKKTGFSSSGDARDVKVVKNGDRTIILVTNNNGPVDVYSLN